MTTTTIYTVTNHLTDTSERFYNSADAAQYCVDHLSKERYDEYLDECYGMVEVCGLTYYASNALYRVDEVAYRCGMNDWADSEYSDLEYELERLDYNDALDWYDFTITTRTVTTEA